MFTDLCSIESLVAQLDNSSHPLEQIKVLNFISAQKLADPQLLTAVASLTAFHDSYPQLEMLQGHSLGEYALATLAWVATPVGLQLYRQRYEQLSVQQKGNVDRLIKSRLYKYLC